MTARSAPRLPAPVLLLNFFPKLISGPVSRVIPGTTIPLLPTLLLLLSFHILLQTPLLKTPVPIVVVRPASPTISMVQVYVEIGRS